MTPDPRPTAASEHYLGLLGIVAALAIAAGIVYAMAQSWTQWHTVLVLVLVGAVAGIYAWKGARDRHNQDAAQLMAAWPPGLWQHPDSLDLQRRISAANAQDQIRSRQMRDGLLPKPNATPALPDLWQVGAVDSWKDGGL